MQGLLKMEVLGCGYTLMCGNICATDVHLCCITGYLYFVQNLHCSKPPEGGVEVLFLQRPPSNDEKSAVRRIVLTVIGRSGVSILAISASPEASVPLLPVPVVAQVAPHGAHAGSVHPPPTIWSSKVIHGVVGLLTLVLEV